MATDTSWAYTHGLISAAQKEQLDAAYAGRLPEINAAIQALCGVYMTNTAQRADPSFQPIYAYLNDPAVRAALHVPPEVPALKVNWSQAISDNYQAQLNDSYLPVVQELLDGGEPPDFLLLLDGQSKLKIQVVSGLNDAKDCNFLGTGAWLERVRGPAGYAFRSASCTPWRDAHGNVLGMLQDGGQLSWLKVLNAGHMAARDQPQLVHYVLDALNSR
jgi:cathepsin A (carboxypeptidase C)